jgi:hypothetical protein
MKSIDELARHLHDYHENGADFPAYDELMELVEAVAYMHRSEFIRVDEVKIREKKLIQGAFDLVVNEISLLYPRHIYKDMDIKELT